MSCYSREQSDFWTAPEGLGGTGCLRNQPRGAAWDFQSHPLISGECGGDRSCVTEAAVQPKRKGSSRFQDGSLELVWHAAGAPGGQSSSGPGLVFCVLPTAADSRLSISFTISHLVSQGLPQFYERLQRSLDLRRGWWGPLTYSRW